MSGVTFAEFVKMLPVEEPLTQEVLNLLENLEPLCFKDIDLVAKLTTFEIGKFIAHSFPDKKRKALDIAAKLKAEFERYGCAHSPSIPSTPTQEALGVGTQPIIHPLTLEPIQGADDAGLDYSQLDEELRKAVIWAKLTNHPLFPQPVRLAEDGAALFQSPLPAPWNLILRDYWNALDSQQAVAVPLEVGQLQDPGQFQPQSRNNYESIVRHYAREKELVLQSYQTVEGIYNQLEVLGSAINLKKVVILDKVNLIGSNISGTIVIPNQSVIVRKIGFNINVDTVIVPWKQIVQNYNLST